MYSVSVFMYSVSVFMYSVSVFMYSVSVFMYSVRYPTLMKLEFYLHISEKQQNNKFLENPSSGSRVVRGGRTDGRTDRHDETNSLFRNFSKAHKKQFKEERTEKS
jgi:hypothetical protein